MPDRRMASTVAPLTTVDVYELASGIGNQFEKMIDTLGTDSITGLMPMVIRALEHLEELTSKLETENEEVCELKFTIERLQAEKKLKAEEKLKYEKELEQIEESWRGETQSQREVITKLQEENHRLVHQHKFNESENIELIDEYNELQEEIERLKSIILKQRDELRSLDKNLNQQTNDAEMLETKVKQLCRQNSDYTRKSLQFERLAQNAIFEKSTVQTQLNDKERLIMLLKEKMKRFEDNLNYDEISPQEQKRLYDHQDVVEERDSLRVKVQTLQEELALYKTPYECSCLGSVNAADDDDDDDDNDPPVQGPINKEPDEKLYPEKYKRHSGIRRFFKNLLSPIKSSPMIPLKDPLQNSNLISSLSMPRRASTPNPSSLSLFSSQKCHPF